MSDLTRMKGELDKSSTAYRQTVCGQVVTILIYQQNAPIVYKFKNGKYIR